MNIEIEKFKATLNLKFQSFIELIQADAYAQGASDALNLTPEQLKVKTDEIKAKLMNNLFINQ